MNDAAVTPQELKVLIQEVISQNFDDEESLCAFIFDKVSTRLTIKIKGKDYQSSFPTSFAQSLIEIQNNFYRAVSIALFGEENLKRLTAEKRKQYELIFIVSKGSTEVESDYRKSFFQFCKDIMKDMPPKTKAVTLLTLALIVTGGVLGYQYINYLSDTDKEKQQTVRLTRAIDKLAENQERNIAAVLKGVRGADEATINDQVFDKAAIADANQRAERIPHQSDTTTGTFRIVIASTKEQGSIDKFTLTSAQTGEIPSIFDEDNFNQEDIDKVWDAIKNKRPIQLTLTLDKQGDNIKQSVITAVH